MPPLFALHAWMFSDLWSRTPQHIPLGKTWQDLYLRDFAAFATRLQATGGDM